MKDVTLFRNRILITAAVLAASSFTFVPRSMAGDSEPVKSAKTLERDADKALDAAKDSKAAAEQLTKRAVAEVAAPASEKLRHTLATATEAALTKGGFSDLVKHFVDSDRERLSKFKPVDKFVTLDGRIESFHKNWKSKYGEDFNFAKNANTILGNDFASISQGEIGEMTNADGKKVPSNEPKVIAGTADMLKKSGVSNIDANSAKAFGGETNKNVGRNIATVLIPATKGMPELAIPMIHEMPASWKIDLSDSIDGQRLADNVLKHLTMVDEDRANWPADINEGYRVVTRHILTAVMEMDRSTTILLTK